MNPPLCPLPAHRRAPLALLPFAGLLVLLMTESRAEDTQEIVAVYSSVSPDYKRSTLADGSFTPESYAFGEGGVQDGEQKDAAFESIRFLDVARVMAPPLAAQKYLPCDRAEPRQTDLLIMVYWGTTIGTDHTSSSGQYQIAQSLLPPPRAALSPAPNGLGGTAMVSDPSASGRAGEAAVLAAIRNADNSALDQSALITRMANRQRDRQTAENAAILGYLPELRRVAAFKMTALDQRRDDVVAEVEESRYYVVLMAYDFQTLLRRKERKLLWENRFSIRQHRNDFSRELAAMAQSASRYFGQDSGGLQRKPLPSVRVDLGELKSLGPDR